MRNDKRDVTILFVAAVVIMGGGMSLSGGHFARSAVAVAVALITIYGVIYGTGVLTKRIQSEAAALALWFFAVVVGIPAALSLVYLVLWPRHW